jgi:hypothetical protein
VQLTIKSHPTICWMAAALLGAAGLTPVQAQERIYRCGNEYINNAQEAKARGCKLMEGGNLTIVQGTTPRAATNNSSASSGTPRSSSSSGSAAPRNDSAEQRSRDSDARAILEAELRKAEERLAQATKAYANGEPEKEGIEGRNHQRYLDRVAELKAALARAESDVAGIKRELARLSGRTAASGASAAK